MLTSLAQISNKDLQTMCWERRTDDTSAFIDTLMVPDAPSCYELLNLFTEALTDMLTGRHRVVYTNSNSYESFHINSDGEVVLFTLQSRTSSKKYSCIRTHGHHCFSKILLYSHTGLMWCHVWEAMIGEAILDVFFLFLFVLCAQ